jgi:hypothetical protein
MIGLGLGTDRSHGYDQKKNERRGSLDGELLHSTAGPMQKNRVEKRESSGADWDA